MNNQGEEDADYVFQELVCEAIDCTQESGAERYSEV
jgi:hypothetical protein